MTTRQFNTLYHCSNCGCMTCAQTSFGRWIRDNPQLDSSRGLVVYDIDYIVHKFKSLEGRSKQLMMFVEVKTRDSQMTQEQRDSLYMASQVTQNRRSNIELAKKRHKWNANDMHGLSNGETLVYSPYLKKVVTLLHFGFFSLQFSGIGPEDSQSIKWNGKEIDKDDLTKLLAFDIDPVTFEDIKERFRSHHTLPRLPLLEKNGVWL